MSRMRIKNLYVKHKDKYILQDISFQIEKNKVLGITGESGGGKSILSKALLRLLPEDTFHISGAIDIEEIDIMTMSQKQLRIIRGRDIGIIFQNPMTAFNPIIKIGKQMIETILSHEKISKKDAKHRVINTLEKFHLMEVSRIMNSYPYQLSGGMMQRVVIANIMLLKPGVLIADEPTTGLDQVTKEAIISELMTIKETYQSSLVLVSHDYKVLEDICDEILVMKDGRVVEYGERDYIVHKSNDVYVRKLFDSKVVIKDGVIDHFRNSQCK